MNLAKEKCGSMQEQDKEKNWKIEEKGNMFLIQTNEKGDNNFQGVINKIVNKEPWTEKEELKIIIAHNKFKNRWSEISAALKGRDNNTIKNKFYSIFRRIKGKIQKSDYTYETRLELLETYYIISLIEHYLKNPPQNPKTKGKRGKDFIYTLVHNITKDIVEEYKEHIQKLAKNEGTMEDLFKKLNDEFRVSDASQTEISPPVIPTPATTNPPASFVAGNIATVNSPHSFDQSTVCIPVLNSMPKTTLPPLSIQTVNQTLKLLPSLQEEPKFIPQPLIELIPDVKSINKRENTETFLGQVKPLECELPLNFDTDFAQPASLFSPPTLSAGPAAAAAGASRAACFCDLPGDCTEFSSIARRARDQRMRQMDELNFPGNSTKEGNKDQFTQFSGFQHLSYFHQQ